jgi:protein-tyrosine phosphatase
MQRLLILCSGNYYRSRFAEIFFNWHAERLDIAWRADSRGLAIDARNPGPISAHTERCLRHHGISSAALERMPLDVTEQDFAQAAVIVAVKEAEHRPLVERRFPRWAAKVEYWGIHDIDCAPPAEAIPLLEQKLLELLADLNARCTSTAWLSASQAG